VSEKSRADDTADSSVDGGQDLGQLSPTVPSSRRCVSASAASRPAVAVDDAELALELDELGESAWRLLMCGHTAAGNVASASVPRLRRAL
jgi:hypothetical protein